MNIDFNPTDPAFHADPFPLFRRMQDDDPIHWSPRLKSWVLTRYDDIKAVCQNQSMSSDRLTPFFKSIPSEEAARIGNIMRYLSQWMVFKDPPDHTRLRRLTSRVFHVKSMHAMRPVVERLVMRLLDGLEGKRELDFITDFAGPLPALVIMAMLGVPEQSLPQMKQWSDEMALFIGSSRPTIEKSAAEKYDVAEAGTRNMAQFFLALIAARRASPQADLISELVHLRDGDDKLSDDELVATCILLLFAGHETTTNHIANGLLSLLKFPDQADKLRATPKLANAAIEELLRYDGPSGAQVRSVGVAHEMHGKTLNVGDRVFMMLNAANRDPRAYDAPDTLEIERDGKPHVTFGFGMHICLGFPLARMEGQVALPAVLQRWRSIQLTAQQPDWINSLVFRGMKTMPVQVG
jgi:cytochrome P450